MVPYDYFGESGALNALLRLKFPVVECCDAVTSSYVDILVLPKVQFFLLDDNIGTIHGLKKAFVAKRQWRTDRYDQLQTDRGSFSDAADQRVKDRSKRISGHKNNNSGNSGTSASEEEPEVPMHENNPLQDLWSSVTNHLGVAAMEGSQVDDNDYVSLDSLIKSREDKKENKRRARLSRISLCGGGGDQSQIQSIMSDDDSTINTNFIGLGLNSASVDENTSAIGNGIAGGTGAITIISPPIKARRRHRPISPDQQTNAKLINTTKGDMKNVMAKPQEYRSMAIVTKLNDTFRDVRLIQDSKEFVSSLPQNIQNELRYRMNGNGTKNSNNSVNTRSISNSLVNSNNNTSSNSTNNLKYAGMNVLSGNNNSNNGNGSSSHGSIPIVMMYTK